MGESRERKGGSESERLCQREKKKHMQQQRATPSKKPLTFQHRQASERCCMMTRALFALMPSGIMSRMSCMTEARSSRSYWLSTRCFVTVFATPLFVRPSNCRASRLPSQRSSSGTTPRRKKSHTRHPGAQKPTPGPLPTGPVLNL